VRSAFIDRRPALRQGDADESEARINLAGKALAARGPEVRRAAQASKKRNSRVG
jgi:hypothetical protein